MNNNSYKSAFKILLISAVSAVVAVTARIILTLTLLDADYGVYRHGSIAPTFFHIILALICGGLILFSTLKAPKLPADHSISTDSFTVFASFAAAMLLCARILSLLWTEINYHALSRFDYLEIVFAFASVIYFIGLALKKKERSPVLAVASVFPTCWCIVCLVGLYFDTGILMTSPNKILGLVSLLAAMIYFLCEIRFQTANVSHRLYLAAASVCPLLLLTSALPNVICFNRLAVGSSDDLLRYATEVSLGLFVYARLFAYVRSLKEPHGTAPEENI